MADSWPALGSEAFAREARAFVVRSTRSPLAWSWVAGTDAAGSHGEGFLRTAPFPSEPARGACARCASRAHADDSSCAFEAEDELPAEAEDEHSRAYAPPQAPGHSLELHIALHRTYAVPTLLIRGTHADGAPLGLEDVWLHVSEDGALVRESPFHLSQLEHPVLGSPCVGLHPCNTPELLRLLLGGAPGAEGALLVGWWSVVAPLLAVPNAAAWWHEAGAQPAGQAPTDAPDQQPLRLLGLPLDALARIVASAPSAADVARLLCAARALASPVEHALRLRARSPRLARSNPGCPPAPGTRGCVQELLWRERWAERFEPWAAHARRLSAGGGSDGAVSDCMRGVGAHTLLARGADGALVAFGSGRRGQLGMGDGGLADGVRPRCVPALSRVRVVAVAAGTLHSLCASDRGVTFAWGDNQHGQLGLGADDALDEAQRVATPTVVSALRHVHVCALAASHHSLALCVDDGGVFSWGLGDLGQLGHGDRSLRRSEPRRVLGDARGLPAADRGGASALLAGCRAVSASDSHSVAVGVDGRLYAWGFGGNGQLGHGGEADELRPVCVCSAPLDTERVIAAAAGNYHTVCVTARGRAFACGFSGRCPGRLGGAGGASAGASTGATKQRTMRMLGMPEGVLLRACAAGTFHSLLASADGRVFAFGDGEQGKLGGGSAEPALAPVAVDCGEAARGAPLRPACPGEPGAGCARVVAVAVGWDHSAVLRPHRADDEAAAGAEEEGRRSGAEDLVLMFGANAHGQLGLGDWEPRYTPVPLMLPEGSSQPWE